MCSTSFNINVHLVVVSMWMSPILMIYETLYFPIFTMSKSPTLYVEKYFLSRTHWYDNIKSTIALDTLFCYMTTIFFIAK